MRQDEPASKFEASARRKGQRLTLLVAAGLILAFGAVAVLNRSAERVQTSADFAVANAATRLLAVPTQDAASSERARAIVDGLKSRFERSDEPATDEDSMKPHGG